MTVYLVGAGPGDPGLMTVRGAQLLACADVVVHDRLIDARLLELTPLDAERIDVGKRPGESGKQVEINSMLVDYGRRCETVVRLKGGDPFVLGRGGEEAMALAAASVAFEVVPGVTSAVAVPASAGIPVTHRGLAESFTVVTGHRMEDSPEDVDWDALGRAGGTVVVLMGVTRRAEIARRLMEGGRPPETPVAAIRWGTSPRQAIVRTTVGRLGSTAVEPPSTIVIGEVAGLDLRTRP